MIFKQVPRIPLFLPITCFRVWQMIVLRMPEHKYAVFVITIGLLVMGWTLKTASSDL